MSTEEKSLNFIEQIIEEDLKNGLSKDKLRFRFPPEPNGYLHVVLVENENVIYLEGDHFLNLLQ